MYVTETYDPLVPVLVYWPYILIKMTSLTLTPIILVALSLSLNLIWISFEMGLSTRIQE